jgi:hypothetical protein
MRAVYAATNTFSKQRRIHCWTVALYASWYNFAKAAQDAKRPIARK